MDGGKVHNPWNEDVDLEPPEAGFVAIGAPVQDPPPVIGVPRSDSVEPIVPPAKLLLDGLCTAGIRGDAKDIEVLWLTTLVAHVEHARHPSDEATVLYPNLPERVDGEVGDVENLPVTRHVGKEVGGMEPAPDKR